ncbi:MAG: hypothetical protein ACTSQI_20870 [Candidatus Helarchaeota archaeon]
MEEGVAASVEHGLMTGGVLPIGVPLLDESFLVFGKLFPNHCEQIRKLVGENEARFTRKPFPKVAFIPS